jgi:hypothetical protein
MVWNFGTDAAFVKLLRSKWDEGILPKTITPAA